MTKIQINRRNTHLVKSSGPYRVCKSSRPASRACEGAACWGRGHLERRPASGLDSWRKSRGLFYLFPRFVATWWTPRVPWALTNTHGEAGGLYFLRWDLVIRGYENTFQHWKALSNESQVSSLSDSSLWSFNHIFRSFPTDLIWKTISTTRSSAMSDFLLKLGQIQWWLP